MKKFVKEWASYFVFGMFGFMTCGFLTQRQRCWYVHEVDRADACTCLHAAGINKNIDSGLCGWAKAPDICFVRWQCGWKQYMKACQYANQKGIQIYNNNVGY